MAHPPSNSSAPAGEQEMYALFAKWQILDEVTAQMFGMAIGSFIVIFTVAHWTERLFNQKYNHQGTIRTIARSIAHPLRRIHGPKIIWGITIYPGKLHIIFAYLGMNVTMVIHDQPFSAPIPTIMAKRFGWLALCNMCLAVFLGLKNTPLSPLTGRSFEALNGLHRCSGYVTVAFVVLHGIIYLLGLARVGMLHEVMSESANIAGAVAGIFMVLLFVTAVGFVRKRQYELFYAMHLVFVAGILITVGLHRPDLSLKAAIITFISGTMWFMDKSLRLSRWIYYGINNSCILTPLPDEGVRITMQRPMRAEPISAEPSSVAFLWIPGIKLIQRHPFTLVRNEPHAEFVVKARDGFTRDLYNAACKNPGIKLRAAVEGPYGNVPDAKKFDKVVIIAGGSGITFAMSQALHWAKKRRTPKDKSSMDLIWSVRRRKNFEWFRDELADLNTNDRVNLNLYVSGPSHEQYVTELPSFSTGDTEKVTITELKSPISSRTSSESVLRDSYVGRPDVEMIIKYAVESQPPENRVLVLGCGPAELITSIRMAVAAKTVKEASSIRMHLEEFCF